MKSEQTDILVPELRRWISSIADGRRTWGSYTVAVGRYGSVNHVLRLYPPGISAQQRRRIRLWRSWLGLGTVGAVGVFAVLTRAGAPSLVIVLACAAFYILGAVAVARHAGPIRHRVLELRAGESSLVPDPRRAVECEYVAGLAAVLSAADNSLDQGDFTPAEHEVVWSDVYDEARNHFGMARSR